MTDSAKPTSATNMKQIQKAVERLIARFQREYRDLTDGQFGTVEDFPEVKTVRALLKLESRKEQP